MRKIYLLCLALLLSASQFLFGQVTYNQNFDTNIGSWTSTGSGTFGRSTTTPCAGAGSARVNLYSFTTNSNFVSPLTGSSNGGDVTLNYVYKIIDYSGGTATANPWGTILVQYASSTAGPWMTVQTIDASNHTPATSCAAKSVTFPAPVGDLYIRFSTSWTAGDYWIYLDEIAITQGAAPSCFVPTNFTATALTPTGGTISWDAPSSGTPAGYQWEVRTSGAGGSGATGLAASGNTNAATLSAAVTGLTANTSYNIYVRTDCGSGSFSSWGGPKPFTTPCTATALPYTQNFESATVPNMPSCTSTENAGAGNNWTVSNAPGSGFTSKTLQYAYNTANAANAWFYTQGLTLTGGVSYRITYRYGNNSTTYTEKLEVKYGNAANSASMTEPIADHPSIIGATANNALFEFTPATSGVYYIGFHAYSIADQYNLYVDDINVMVTPTCEVPTSVAISAITTTAADVSWVDPTTGSGPINYQIYYSTTNTAPTGSTTPSVTGATSPSTITGLTANTTYYVWVRTNCGSGDFSSWTAAVSFTTACNTTTVPYSQNFETATVPNLPACTQRENAGSGNNWTVSNAPGSGFTSKTLQYSYSGVNAANAWFYIQGLNLTGGTSYRITYRYGNNNSTYTEKMEVKFGNAPNSASMTELIASHPSINTATPNNAVYDFIPSTTGVYYIGFHVYSDPDQWNLYVDDITVTVTPTCDVPTAVSVSNISTTGADVDWTAPTLGSPVNYQIYYSTTNTAPTGSTTPTVTGATSPATLTGLTANTTYYLWVRTNCGGTDLSEWTPVPVSFTTLCVSATALSENFNTVTTPALPSCWKKLLRNTAGIASLNTIGSNANSAPNAVEMYNSSSTAAADIILVSPPLSNLAAGTHQLRFWARNSTASQDIQVGTLDGNTATAVFTPLQTVDINTTYAEYTVDFSGYTGSDLFIGIRRLSTSTFTYVYVDDVNWEVVPTCLSPTNLLVTGVTATGAQVDWTASSSAGATNYSWELRTSGAAGSGATGLVSSGNTSTLTQNFTTLNGGTTYTFYVRTNCTAPDVSSWSQKSFVTLPANDDCANAIQVYNNTPVNGSTFGATSSMAAGTCAGFTGTADDDVWYMFTTNYAGNVTISMTNASAAFDAVVIAYSGTCGAFTAIGCSDAVGGGSNETINLTGLAAATTYYFRVYSYGGAAGDAGTYTITLTGTALPVTLLEFSGESANGANRLSWKTATETNNAGFELQRSADGQSFSSLGFVATKAENGNSTVALNYHFTDGRPLGGTNYYRLKQMDRDGKFTYSNIVVLKSKVSAVTLSSVYPNPATAELKLVITSPSSEKITVVVTDLSGKVLMQRNAQLAVGDNHQQLDVRALAAGTYLVKAICANGCETTYHRFVKQ